MSMLVAARPRLQEPRHDDESRCAGPEHVATHSQAVGADEKKMGRLVVSLDSGASGHAIGDEALLAAFTVAGAASAAVHRARDGRELPVAGAGILACEGFHVPDVPGVRLVPALGPGIALVSVAQLTASGYLVAFGGGACYVRDPRTGSLLGRGRRNEDDGLYHLDFLRIPD